MPTVARTRARLAGIPAALAAAIATAWALAFAAEVTGRSELLRHGWLVDGGVPVADAMAIHLGAWLAMIVAMMLPTSLPLVRLFRAAAAGQEHASATIAALIGGYATVWVVFGALAFGVDLLLHAAIEASPPLASAAWALPGLTLAAAGAFQFSALKEACLRQCRHPATFLLRHYRRGVGASLRLGAHHGLFCVGCCWALMLVLFAVGVASLLWMAVLTAVIVYEKTGSRGAWGVPIAGMALLGAAAIVLPYSAWAHGVLA